MDVFVFPGQGSQKRGMGSELFDDVEEFLSAEKDIDAILGYSVRTLCLEDPDNQLGQTQYTQPALYIANALQYFKRRSEGAEPAYLAGHSLGEYNALLAAGAFDFLTGLRLVQKRGALMAAAKSGGMAAVIGLSPERIRELHTQHGLTSLDIANLNSPSQTVIAGPSEDIERAGPVMTAAGAKLFVPLPVSAAFHSRYMVAAGREFENFLAPVKMNPLRIPVISNVTARPYPMDDSGEATKNLLVRQISEPVQWSGSVTYLRNQGATVFEEIGPGKVLTKLIQQIDRVSRPNIA